MKKGVITKEYFEEVVRESKYTLFQLSFSILKNRTDAEDAVAESLMTAWRKKHKVRDPKKFPGWLSTIVVNTSKTMYRDRYREIAVDMRAMPLVGTVEDFETSDVWLAITGLGENHRDVLLRYYFEGYSVKEIAEMFGIPEGTVKSRLSRARKELERMLTDAEEDLGTEQQERWKKGHGEYGYGEKE